MKLLVFSVLSFLLTFCSLDTSAKVKVTVEYMEQVTVSSHKLHVVVIETDEAGAEKIVATGVVYTHAKKTVSGAMYKGDAYVTDADSPSNLVAAVSSPKVYDIFKAECDKIVARQIIK